MTYFQNLHGSAASTDGAASSRCVLHLCKGSMLLLGALLYPAPFKQDSPGGDQLLLYQV